MENRRHADVKAKAVHESVPYPPAGVATCPPNFAPVAQRLERHSYKVSVKGSSPFGSTFGFVTQRSE